MMSQCFTPCVSLNHMYEDHKILKMFKTGKGSTFVFLWDDRTLSQLTFSEFSSWELYSLKGNCVCFH